MIDELFPTDDRMDASDSASAQHGVVRRPHDAVRTFKWLPLLRRHCEALNVIPPHLVSAISTTTRLETDTPIEAEAIREAAHRMAQEFGFSASVRINGSGVSVRFSRGESPCDGLDERETGVGDHG
jgi:hypothetical protein